MRRIPTLAAAIPGPRRGVGRLLLRRRRERLPRCRLDRLLPRRRFALALVLGAAWAVWGGGDVVHAAGWRAPVDGAVTASFDFEPARPYAANRRRGLELAARRGEPVRSACGGEVTFAGRLPGGGVGVTVRCGSLAATHLRLAGASVRRGARVPRGARLGTAAGGSVRLGARWVGERHGYVDPAALLAPGPSAAPPLAPARPRSGRPPPPAPLPAASARPVQAVQARLRPPPLPAPAAGGGGVPLVAWAGLVLLAVGVPAGGVARGRRRRRRSAGELAREPAGAGGRCR